MSSTNARLLVVDDEPSMLDMLTLLFADEGTLAERTDDVEKEFQDNPIVKEIVAFIRAGSKRGLCVPHIDA